MKDLRRDVIPEKLFVSHNASGDEWFVVMPREGETVQSIVETPITQDMAVASLRRSGRSVYELVVTPWDNEEAEVGE